MLDTIKRIVTPPVFEDENETRRARLLNVMLLIILGFMVLTSPLLLKGSNFLINSLIILPTLAAIVGLLYMLRRGRITLTSVILTIVLLAATTLNNVFYDGVRGPVHGYFLIVVIPSLLLSGRATLAFGAACLLIMAGLYGAEVMGWLWFDLPIPVSFMDYLIPAITLAMTTLLLWSGAETLNHALAQSQRDARVLSERTEELEASHTQLEQEVAEREQAELERAQALEENAQYQQKIIEAQQQALKELSTPVIPVLEHVIVMPLVGNIDTLRARDIMRALLQGVGEHQAHIALLDVTGVPLMDTGVVGHIDKAIQAARLKGARVFVTGISDAVAESIVDLGINWGAVETLSDLQTGLRVALEQMGIVLQQKRAR